MTLPLRDAREVFEREYLLAQVTRFGGNISRTAAFVGMERSALHRKLKSLGVLRQRAPAARPGPEGRRDVAHRLCQRPLSAALARPRVHIEDRGFQFADGVYEVIGGRGGKLVDEAPHLARLRPLAGRTAHRARRWRDAALEARDARGRAAQRRRRRHRLSAGHARRRAARSCLSEGGASRSLVVTARRASACRSAARRGRRRGDHDPRHPLGAPRHQDRSRCSQCAGQAAGARGRRLRGLAGRRATASSPKAPRPMPGS